MQYFPEFIGNHPLLFALLFGLLIALIWTVATDALIGKTAIHHNSMVNLVNRKHALVVDLRGSELFTEGHIVSAISMPSASAETLLDLAKKRERPLLLYCPLGHSSSAVARTLRGKGLAEVYTLKGGFSEWQRATLPIVRERQ